MELVPAVRVFMWDLRRKQMATIEQQPYLRPDLGPEIAMLAAAIARSPIVVAQAPARRRLPDGFEDVDVAVLDWIAAEGRRVGRSLIRI
jgi:hypothetical protein